jgi:hypothetical protein
MPTNIQKYGFQATTNELNNYYIYTNISTCHSTPIFLNILPKKEGQHCAVPSLFDHYIDYKSFIHLIDNPFCFTKLFLFNTFP